MKKGQSLTVAPKSAVILSTHAILTSILSIGILSWIQQSLTNLQLSNQKQISLHQHVGMIEVVLYKCNARTLYFTDRLRTERNGGAWCPQNQIDSTVHEWIQIDLQTLHRITAVETQGRFGNGQVRPPPGFLNIRAKHHSGENSISGDSDHTYIQA